MLAAHVEKRRGLFNFAGFDALLFEFVCIHLRSKLPNNLILSSLISLKVFV
jgi:hypothetical protein